MAAKVFSYANHKGGVCKTTLTVCLADAFSREGYRVLVLDLDPQGNATRLLYSFDDAPPIPLERLLDGTTSIAEAILQNTRIDNVHLIGSTLKLANLEDEMRRTPFSATTMIRTALEPVRDVYDVILLDTPPALNFLTANALAASNMVFVPIESGSKLSLLGTDDMLRFIAQAKRANPGLEFGGAILTKHDARKTMCKLAAASIEGYYNKVLQATLPPSTDIHKAQAAGQTILQYDREHTASRNVVAMAREMATLAGLTPSREVEHV
jgi:chromosome partitioning protein